MNAILCHCRKWWWAYLFVALSTTAKAEWYAGGGIGMGASENIAASDFSGDPSIYSYILDERDARDWTGQMYIGVRYGYLGAELGHTWLPDYYSHAIAPNPYRDIQHTITARGFYGRALLWGPRWELRPYLFYGQARIEAKSREWGWREDQGAVEFTFGVTNNSRLRGIGVEWKQLRLEYSRYDHAVSSWWTGDREYRTTTLNWNVRF